MLPEGDIPPDLVDRLAERSRRKVAIQILHMCIRALDYCPPVDLTFGDYLRALITADRDLVQPESTGIASPSSGRSASAASILRTC